MPDNDDTTTSDTGTETETASSDAGGMTPEQTMMMAATASSLVARNQFANRAGLQFDGDRDVWEALGYQSKFTYRDYRDWYERGDIAKPIINKPPQTTWSERPDVVDDAESGDGNQTDFESDVEDLFDASGDVNLDRGLSHYLERADKLARIGRYGVLFLGFADADNENDLKQPVDGSELDSLDDLLYVTPLGEGDADVNEWVRDVTDPRNGLPKTYRLDLANGKQTQSVVVHHSRVIHIAEDVLDNEVHGEPALQPVMNRLFDIQKVAGASAEAFWMTANPGLALSVDPSLEDVSTDKMDEQVEEYEHNMRRVLKMYGTDVEQLPGQDVDPSGVLDSIMKLISGTIEIPRRKLEGSEQGELASSQDESNYLEMISGRQESFAEPVLLRPLLDRLVELGVLSPPSGGTYTVEWPNLFQLTELEEADLLKAYAETVKTLAPMGEPDTLHSLEALREFSPIDELEEATPPDQGDDVDEEIDEDDEEVQEQFDRMTGGDTGAVEADD